MHLLTWIILFSLLGGVLSVLGAALFLVLPERWRSRLLPHLISFATGALLAAAFIALLPQALESGADAHAITATVLGGFVGFFLLEKLLLWHHCHALECELEAGQHQAGYLVLVGDGIHNFVDGVLIGAAFLVDIRLGVVTAVAVAAHEVPQELGDFAILLQSGFRRISALAANIASSLTTIIGALIAYFALAGTEALLPFVLAVAAASFIYIAAADLIPGLHRRAGARATVTQLLLIGAGVMVIYGTQAATH